MPPDAPLLEVQEIVKRYPGVTALGGVSLSVRAGEVVALIGENGAGKSTLMKILGGIVKPDSGRILVEGTPTVIDSVRRSEELGISLIHQELSVLDNLDIAGNVFLGRELRKFGLLDRRPMAAQTTELLNRLKLPLAANTQVSSLSLAHRQLVEIAKALSLNARLLVMDEPTSSLTLSETERLLELVQELRAGGCAVIYISHRLAEVHKIADRVVALKDGQNAGELSREEITHDRMVQLMVGRDLERGAVRSKSNAVGRPRLGIKKLRTGRFPASEISFEVAEGEVFCLAGLVGAGRSELVQTVFGADRAAGGTVELDGEPIPLGNPRRSIDLGLGLVPEDRRGNGLLVQWTIVDNVTLPTLKSFSKLGVVRRSAERVAATKETQSLHVKAPSVDIQAANLSGGNQQKVVLAKWLLGNPKVLILDEPTRGVDVGAKAEIYDLIRGLTDQGLAVLIVSSDMEEVLSISDRVGVMHEGALTGILSREEATEERIMHLAVGRG